MFIVVASVVFIVRYSYVQALFKFSKFDLNFMLIRVGLSDEYFNFHFEIANEFVGFIIFYLYCWFQQLVSLKNVSMPQPIALFQILKLLIPTNSYKLFFIG